MLRDPEATLYVEMTRKTGDGLCRMASQESPFVNPALLFDLHGGCKLLWLCGLAIRRTSGTDPKDPSVRESQFDVRQVLQSDLLAHHMVCNRQRKLFLMRDVHLTCQHSDGVPGLHPVHIDSCLTAGS